MQNNETKHRKQNNKQKCLDLVLKSCWFLVGWNSGRQV